MKKLKIVLALGLVLAVAFALFGVASVKTAHAQSGLDYQLVSSQTGGVAGAVIVSWYGISGDVFAIYKDGERVAIQRFFQANPARCVYGNTYYRHVTSGPTRGNKEGYSVYRITINVSRGNDGQLASYLWRNVPAMESDLFSASASGVTGSMTQPQFEAQKRSAESVTQPSSPRPARLDRPSSVSAKLQDDGSLLVSWSAPANADSDATYGIRRRVDTGGKFKVIERSIADGDADDANDAAGQIAYVDRSNSLKTGTPYAYSIRAFHPTIKNSKWTKKVTAR